MTSRSEQKKYTEFFEKLVCDLRCSHSMKLRLEQVAKFSNVANIDFENCVRQILSDYDLSKISKKETSEIIEKIEKSVINEF